MNRLAAGLLWLVAGLTAGAATVFDLYHVSQPPQIEQTTGFWSQTITSSGREIPSGQILYGVSLVLGAVVVLLGGLMVILSRRRWAGVVVGTFGAGALLDDAVHWIMLVLSSHPSEVTFSLRLGFWLTVASAAVAVVGLVVALAGNARPVRPPLGYPPPPPPPLRWEPQTPRFGIPVQQPPPPTPPAQPTPPAPSALEQEDRTVALPDPEPPTPGSISRKLDGNEN